MKWFALIGRALVKILEFFIVAVLLIIGLLALVVFCSFLASYLAV